MKPRLLFLPLLLLLAQPAYPVAKEIIQLQQSIALLQDQVSKLNQLVIEKMSNMNQLVERNTDTINKLQGSIDNVQRALQTSLATQGQKIDANHQQVQNLADSLEDLKARQTKLSDQLIQIRQLLETIQAPPAQTQTPAQQTPAPPPNPKDLYENALRDLSGGKNDLALGEFQDYLKYFSETDLAGNAQFYIGEVYFRKGDWDKAIDAYNAVLDKYPKGNKTPTAHWKKALALLETRQRDAAVRELRTLIRLFPNSDEAKLAKDKLQSMGLTADNRSPSKAAPRKTTARRK